MTIPGEEGKWFATAKELKLYELALQLADQSPCEPKTLIRAARDFLESEPAFSLGAAIAALRWLNEGWGYEVTGMDVVEAYDLALAAAERSQIDNVSDQIRALLDRTYGDGNTFVRQFLSGRMLNEGYVKTFEQRTRRKQSIRTNTHKLLNKAQANIEAVEKGTFGVGH